jgi:hypothetical protein
MARTKVRPLSCARLSIGNVLEIFGTYAVKIHVRAPVLQVYHRVSRRLIRLHSKLALHSHVYPILQHL